MILEKSPRKFIKEGLQIDSWETIKPYYIDLVDRVLDSKQALQKWLEDRSELDAVLEEDVAWRYIRMTIDTANEELAKSYTFFVTQIQPHLAPFEDQLNSKLVECQYVSDFQNDQAFEIYFRSVNSALKLFRTENIPLEAKVNEKSQEFGSISGAQTIVHDGKTMTMQQASVLLKEKDEALRKEVYLKMVDRRKEDVNTLNDLYTELIQLRHEIAINSGFDNFRDYKFEALGRFDYTKEDCFHFHQAIKTEIVPIVKRLQQEKLDKLGKSKFKPWDLDLDPDGLAPLKPFKGGQEMLEGTILLLSKIDPYFSDCIATMAEMKHLDLDSKTGKAPGGYNYPLYEIGVPFIFMNAVGAQRDLVTMVHEAGHAIHSFLSRDLLLTGFKNIPSEVAELASMSMELLSMDYWNEFYSNEDLIRAKKDQLETILKILPWIATIDEFQHWVYTNPNHSIEERYAQWNKLGEEYGTGLTDWEGFEEAKSTAWQRQMHLFEVPFYYIEYGFAQLGAIGVWKNSQSDFQGAITKYKEALKLGYTKSIPEIYETAGVQFDFSSKYLKELAIFLQEELDKL